jgi:2',5'-phosphodiesterase
LVLQEILGYRADVAALQEVDDRMFSLCLTPALGEAGYDGVYTNKAGKVREGAAVFWRRERFALAAQREVALKSLFPADAGGGSKCAAAFEPMLRSSPALRAALQRVGTVAQVLLLVPSEGAERSSSGAHAGAEDDDGALRPLCVVNTHLFYHHAAPHIRTMHVWAILNEAAEVLTQAGADPELRRRCRGRRPALLFCGDLNSDLNDGIPGECRRDTPAAWSLSAVANAAAPQPSLTPQLGLLAGAVELLASGRLPASHWDWRWGAAFKWGKDEEGGEADGAPAAGDEAGEISKMVHSGVEHLGPAVPHSPQEIVPGVDLVSPFPPLAAADGPVLVLVDVADPGNAGTLVRAAEAVRRRVSRAALG